METKISRLKLTCLVVNALIVSKTIIKGQSKYENDNQWIRKKCQ
jgi:hypothetical protein